MNESGTGDPRADLRRWPEFALVILTLAETPPDVEPRANVRLLLVDQTEGRRLCA